MANRRVQSLQVSLYFFLSVLYIRAISGTSGSSGLGSVINAHIESSTMEEEGKRLVGDFSKNVQRML